ncbi:polysaccharide biosynthesis protein [Psychromonas sp. RZ22]|uniref:polysaccharide biosynthesis protein n=1 Tax=Psychromonas algarum TaxID=2555643 RepID=UPI00106897E5|nr:nucleoside-diphosphate sugar epimerase/dehydratase [Psychromonas sp. RZ22]TEW55723.1 polysaccharide biosynthesis protein [Psychromonas sp. RZ22]
MVIIWNLSRTSKRIISLFIDTLFICLAFYFSFWVRLGKFEWLMNVESIYTLVGTIVLTLVFFIRLGLYRAVLRYLTFHALFVIFIGSLLSALALALLSYYLQSFLPRTVPIIYFAFLAILCGGSRLMVRALVFQGDKKGRESVLIYGAGGAGRQLALSLKSSEEYRVVAFVDTDTTLIGMIIQGLSVHHTDNIASLITKSDAKKIFIAVPSASRARRKEIIDSLVHLHMEVLSVPSMEDIVSGKASIDQLGDVPIDDLLGRDPVAAQQVLLEANIKNKVVLVTGAGGSIGSELCRQIIKGDPSAIILFERSEFALYKIENELTQLAAEANKTIRIVPLLGSVQHYNRLTMVMTTFNVNTVYHAAAYKHVPLVEFNVAEGIQNNVFGTYFTAKAAIESKVESFVLISTDKAVRPTNVMGTTKRLAELGLQALAEQEHEKVNGTRFCMVRFGNVLGSSGSVIPLFKKQILKGGPLTVTHPDITRFFMTIPEAAQLVIQAGAMGKGGDVFILDMGDSVKIIDLAKNLIRLSGLDVKCEDNPLGDIEIKFTGLRPGEKLYEELLIGGDVGKTAHERIMTAQEFYLPLNEYVDILEKLDDACKHFDHELIRKILLSTPTGFEPSDGIGDLAWNEKLASSKQKVDKCFDEVAKLAIQNDIKK